METHPVELWTIPLTRDCPTHLSEDEMARANRFRFEAGPRSLDSRTLFAAHDSVEVCG